MSITSNDNIGILNQILMICVIHIFNIKLSNCDTEGIIK